VDDGGGNPSEEDGEKAKRVELKEARVECCERVG
jgi:hypothetical protein